MSDKATVFHIKINKKAFQHLTILLRKKLNDITHYIGWSCQSFENHGNWFHSKSLLLKCHLSPCSHFYIIYHSWMLNLTGCFQFGLFAHCSGGTQSIE